MLIAVSRPRLGAVHIAAFGELDAATAPRLADALQTGLGATPEAVTMDLGGVGFCAAAGLTVLVRAHRTARESGTCLRVVACSPALWRIARLAGLDQQLSLPNAGLMSRPDPDHPAGRMM